MQCRRKGKISATMLSSDEYNSAGKVADIVVELDGWFGHHRASQ